MRMRCSQGRWACFTQDRSYSLWPTALTPAWLLWLSSDAGDDGYSADLRRVGWYLGGYFLLLARLGKDLGGRSLQDVNEIMERVSGDYCGTRETRRSFCVLSAGLMSKERSKTSVTSHVIGRDRRLCP
ncbi:hypothetical protein PYCCODRAFT_1007044 [Trametes coccinea BRFM310]|uniref:Uncharacterized protein n=1 Tax=Trametes coccinea (strain BRFM310) TaxID=1353009 RepID=A0A1Y2ID87_TRAC3|nr:hypothetical protein PYCCODRAFT_1007044 [Trametes coccinea BRFM310]